MKEKARKASQIILHPKKESSRVPAIRRVPAKFQCFQQEFIMTKVENKTDPKSDKRKQSVYFPVDMLDEIQKEALRQDRTVSWIVQRAWKIARDEILLYPSINDPTGEELQAIMAATSEDKDKEE